jgi:autotransporter-associated beta strand protein
MWHSVKPLHWFVIAVVLAVPSAAVSQVQVNQIFVPQGPAPSAGDRIVVGSADNPPNGTVAGAIQAVVADPADPNTFYVGSPNGGIWKTTDGGKAWTPLTDNQASLSIASMSLDPTDPTRKTLIAGTGLTSNGFIGSLNNIFVSQGGVQNGLLYSKDGGTTWTSLGAGTLAGQTVIDVAVRGNVILAATFEPSGAFFGIASGTTGGLYRSTDAGATFTQMAPASGLPPGPITSLVGDPTNTNRFIAAVTASSATTFASTSIYVSNDAGATWTQVFNSGNSAGTIQAGTQTTIKLAAGPSGSIAAGVVDTSTGKLVGLFLSNNGGTGWAQLPTPNVNPGGQAWINIALAIDPTNSKIVYVAGDNNFDNNGGINAVTAFRVNASNNTITSLTDDIGIATNTANGSTVHPDARALTFDASGRLILTSDGGIYARTLPQSNAGVWQGLNGNLQLYELYGIAYDAVSKRLVVSAQDNGSSIQSAPGNRLFNQIGAGDGINAVVNDKTLGIRSAIYTSFQFVGGLQRNILDSQGNIVSPKSGPAYAPGVPVNFTNGPISGAWFGSPLVLNRIDPTRIAVGGNHVYVTQDTLSGVNGPDANTVNLTLTDLGATGRVTALAYGTNDNVNAILAGVARPAGGQLWFSSLTTGPMVQLPSYAGLGPTQVLFDPRSSQRFYVADSINLWATQNQGVAINNLTSNLPTNFIRPTSLEFISNNGVNALLVGGLNQVASAQSPITVADSDAAGNFSNWRAFGQGLPNTTVAALSYNPTVDVLAVGMFGRGAFALYDVTSYFPQATVLQFGLANNDSVPDASFLTNGTVGNRPLIKYGTGTLTIGGDASFTGGTTINRGAVVLGTGGSSGSILGNVTFCGNAADPNCDASNNKALAFNRSDTYTFDGSITGLGQVFQIGSGKTVLTDASTYSGPTFVSSGILSVNGSITSSVFVNNSGTLGGNGSVGATTILLGGALSPGNSVGTITVNGNLVFNPGSFYFVEVFGNTTDRTNVTGSATLAGTVAAAYTGGNLTNTYTILSASSGRIGTFDSLAALNLPAFITASLAYTPTDAQLNLTSGIGGIAGLSRNQSAVAGALDNSFNSGAGSLPGLFGVAASQLPAALDMLSGEGISGTEETAFGASDMFTSIMMDQGAFWRSGESIDVNGVAFGAEPLQYALSKKRASDHPAFKAIGRPAPYQPRWRAWLTGFDGTAKLDGEAGIGSASLSHNTGGLAGGLDYQFAPDVLVGLAIGGSSSNFSVRDRITSGHLEAAHFGGYGVKTWGSLYAALALSFTTFRNSTTRSIVGIGPTETATGSFGSNLFSGRVEVGAKQVFGRFAVTPFAAMQFAELWQNGFTETNPVTPGAAGPLGLTYGSISASSLPTFVGAQFDTRFAFGNGMVLSPYARLSWVHEFHPNRAINAVFIALPGAAFTVDGPRRASDAARIDAGTKLAIRPNAWLFASFNGEFSDPSQSYAGKGGVRVAW